MCRMSVYFNGLFSSCTSTVACSECTSITVNKYGFSIYMLHVILYRRSFKVSRNEILKIRKCFMSERFCNIEQKSCGLYTGLCQSVCIILCQ